MVKIEGGMVKIVIGIVLIFLAGGSWLYLDCLNKREQVVAEQMHDEVDQARTEAKKRAELKVNFEYQINANLTTCKANAEKAKIDYMLLIQKAAPIKRGQPVISQAIIDEAGMILTAANAECQQVYDARMKAGQ